jgi:hypothetical protein
MYSSKFREIRLQYFGEISRNKMKISPNTKVIFYAKFRIHPKYEGMSEICSRIKLGKAQYPFTYCIPSKGSQFYVLSMENPSNKKVYWDILQGIFDFRQFKQNILPSDPEKDSINP